MCQADTGCAAPAAVHFVQEVFRRCRGTQEDAAGVCDAAAETLEFFVRGNLHLLRKGALRPESLSGTKRSGGQVTSAGSQGFRQALWGTVLFPRDLPPRRHPFPRTLCPCPPCQRPP